MYVFGGLDTLGAFLPTEARETGSTLHVLSLDVGEWTTKSFRGRGPGPNMRIYGETCTALKNGMVVALGHESEHVYVLDFERQLWMTPTLVGDKLKSRMFHAGAAFVEDGAVVLFGGQNRKTNDDFGDTFMLNLVKLDED